MVTTDTGMIFIPGNVPSLKNSKQIAETGAGRPVLARSQAVKKYLRSIGIQDYSTKKGVIGYKDPHRPNVFKAVVGNFLEDAPVPCVLGFNFVRGSMHTFDIINAMAIICDLLVVHKFIKDDDVKNLIPVPMKINGSFYSVCRDRPGVYLKIIEDYNVSFDI